MSTPASEYKKKPPPIAIPEWPPSQSASGPNASIKATSHAKGSGQHRQRFASSSIQQLVRSEMTTPLTSPFEPDEVRLAVPQSGSQASKHRSSAMTTLSGLMDQARISPRKSDCGSLPSRHGSTARSRQSERSHHSAAAIQAQLEALDEDDTTTRSQIESRTEKMLFKMTGQIPPTPTTGHIDPEGVIIRTEDLRAQCRAASSEKQSDNDEPARSPKKKLFGVSLPTFSRMAANGTTPAMPSKAAQILGTTPSRRARRVEPRPIKSSRVLKTPTKASRSDSAKSLPMKMYGETTLAWNHYSASTRRRRTTGRSSPGKENTLPREEAAALSSFESIPPPTPPAKDTPPEFRFPKNPTSPLRRAPSHEDLRVSYGDRPDKGVQVQLPFPMFALSPSPPKTAVNTTGGISPTKFRPYTADDYTKLIEGEVLHWPYPDDDDGSEVQTGGHSAPLSAEVAERRALLQLPQSSRSDDKHYSDRTSRRLSPLPPRFYSPSDRSVQLFKEGTSPSQNTDTRRMLFAPSHHDLPNNESQNGSIEMLYQGSMKAVESDSSDTQATNKDCPQTQSKQMSQRRDNVDLSARSEQEPWSSEKRQLSTAPSDESRRVKADTASSKPSDMLENPVQRIESDADFRTICPSAVPSPLHKLNGPHVPLPPAPMLRGGHGAAPAGPWPSPRTHKTIEDHFFMTNEHLDVVGKTTYDALDMYTKQQMNATNAKHEHLTVILEDHVKALKSQINLVNGKVDQTSDQTHGVGVKLDQLEKFLKDEVLAALSEQTKKTAELQSYLKEMHSTLIQTQQAVEKLSATKLGSAPLTSSSLPAAGGLTSMPQTTPTHHSQHVPVTYHGNDAGRDEQLSIPSLQDRTVSNSYDSHSDPRASYSANWQPQAWNGRSSYHGRNKGEVASYAGTNPYHFGNGSQYNNGYMGGYTSYNFSPSTPEQPYAYGQKHAQ